MLKWISIDANSFISWPNPMFDHMLESSWWDDSNKWSNIGFGQVIDVLEIKIRTLSGALYLSLNTKRKCSVFKNGFLMETNIYANFERKQIWINIISMFQSSGLRLLYIYFNKGWTIYHLSRLNTFIIGYGHYITITWLINDV